MVSGFASPTAKATGHPTRKFTRDDALACTQDVAASIHRRLVGAQTAVFTGIVEKIGTITTVRSVPGGRHLALRAGAMAEQCALGASVCVSGVCLTVTTTAGDTIEFDVITETLRRSTLGSLSVGSYVNLERSLRVGDRLDGHFVQGHVDGTACVDRVVASPREHLVWLRADETLMLYVIPKGSVTLDGVSLTIADVDVGRFCVALIPTTLEQTTLGTLSAGDLVNVESDIIARTVVHRLAGMGSADGLTLDHLRRAGLA